MSQVIELQVEESDGAIISMPVYPVAEDLGTDEELESRDPQTLYFKSIQPYRALTAKEELRLFKELARCGGEIETASGRLKHSRIRSRLTKMHLNYTVMDCELASKKAVETLVNHNQRLVVMWANRIRGNSIPLLDRIGFGNIGLLKAIERFDYRRGYKFSTFASFRIRQSIQRGVANTEDIIRIPVYFRERAKQCDITVRRLRFELCREPTVEEIAREASLDEEEARTLLALETRMSSLNREVREDGTELGELIEDTSFESPEECVGIVKTVERRMASVALGALTLHEQSIIERRFGLSGHRPSTLERAGKEQKRKITKERARQIQRRAMEKMRAALNNMRRD